MHLLLVWHCISEWLPDTRHLSERAYFVLVQWGLMLASEQAGSRSAHLFHWSREATENAVFSMLLVSVTSRNSELNSAALPSTSWGGGRGWNIACSWKAGKNKALAELSKLSSLPPPLPKDSFQHLLQYSWVAFPFIIKQTRAMQEGDSQAERGQVHQINN